MTALPLAFKRSVAIAPFGGRAFDSMDIDELAKNRKQSRDRDRFLIGIAGPPASGKSTLAGALGAAIDGAVVVPMDGFHLDNAQLDAMGLRHRKGAPETFDAAGFIDLVKALRDGGQTVAIPEFDRATDSVVDHGLRVAAEAKILLIEGNYLLLRDAPWDALGALLILTVFVAPDEATLEARLLARWRTHGFDEAEARAKAEGNDLPNARKVLQGSRPADIHLR